MDEFTTLCTAEDSRKNEIKYRIKQEEKAKQEAYLKAKKN